jgi:hypothetical protein
VTPRAPYLNHVELERAAPVEQSQPVANANHDPAPRARALPPDRQPFRLDDPSDHWPVVHAPKEAPRVAAPPTKPAPAPQTIVWQCFCRANGKLYKHSDKAWLERFVWAMNQTGGDERAATELARSAMQTATVAPRVWTEPTPGYGYIAGQQSPIWNGYLRPSTYGMPDAFGDSGYRIGGLRAGGFTGGFGGAPSMSCFGSS